MKRFEPSYLMCARAACDLHYIDRKLPQPSFTTSVILTLMQTGILHQNLLPHFLYDRRIRLHCLVARQLGFLTEHLSDNAAPVCGVSVPLSKDHAGLDGIAFATTTDVFYANFACAGQELSHGMSNLARVLDGSLCALVGFGMPRLALHLHRRCGLHVEGVELATLFTFKNKKFQTAADFTSKRIHPDANWSRIYAVWYGNDVEDVCLRAWLSAVYMHVFSIFADIADITNSVQSGHGLLQGGAMCSEGRHAQLAGLAPRVFVTTAPQRRATGRRTSN